ncbi:hypothetical protein HOD61_01630 [archaeon]|nr:hypothetical protein [archaeon]
MRDLIDCNNFGCLRILEKLVYDKLESETISWYVTEIGDNLVGLNYYLRTYDEAYNHSDVDLKRNYFIGRINAHVSQLEHYFETNEVLMR